MEDAGKLLVETPEQVGIEFDLAGLGSRFLAALIDLACMVIFLIAALVIAFLSMNRGAATLKRIAQNTAGQRSSLDGVGAAAIVVILLSVFVVVWGYYIICEQVTGGASPGKRALGLRVIRDNGLPLGFTQSLIRNLVRVVDFLPGSYGVGLVAIFASERSQRLGDMAAGTLVIRIQPDAATRAPRLPRPRDGAGALLTDAEQALVVAFVARRQTLLPGARQQLASQIAAALRARLARTARPPEGQAAENHPDEKRSDEKASEDERWLESLIRDLSP